MNLWLWSLLASTLLALGVAVFAHGLIVWVGRTPPDPGSSVESDRRTALRAHCAVYRMAEAVVADLAAWNAARWPARVAWLDRRLIAAGRAGKFTGAELLAVSQIEGGLVGLAAALLALAWPAGWLGIPFVLTVGGLTALIRVFSVLSEAEARGRSVRLRLPAALELIGLLLDAGLGLSDSLKAYVEEAGDHPLASELRRLLHDVRSGIPRRDAFEDMARRIDLDIVDELVAALVEGDAGGTPLAEGLRTQAAQLRLRQSQWVEEAAGRANSYIKGPEFIMMLACMILVVTPFVIGLYVTGAFPGL